MGVRLQDVKMLRSQTGAGVQECKRALEASSGDVAAAHSALTAQASQRVRGRASQRSTATGVIAVGANVAVELRCETDFVAESEAFVAFAQRGAALANEHSGSTRASLHHLLASDIDVLASRSGEKIEIGRVVSVAGEEGAARMVAQQVYATDPASMADLMGQAWLRDGSHTVAEALGSHTTIHEFGRVQV